jgi:hypothetical protein
VAMHASQWGGPPEQHPTGLPEISNWGQGQ